MPFRCREKGCAKRFSTRTGTVMECSNLGFQLWAIALFLFATNLKGISSMKLHRDLGFTRKTAWFLAHRIRETWQETSAWLPGFHPFDGPIEADETYLGGKRKNMSHEKRKQSGEGEQWARWRWLVSRTAEPERSVQGWFNIRTQRRYKALSNTMEYQGPPSTPMQRFPIVA